MEKIDNKFVWVIKNFSSLQPDKWHYSVPFQIGHIKWRLVAYLTRYDYDGYDDDDYLSLYMEVADFQLLPSGWRQYAESKLTIVHQNHVEREIRHWFDEKTTSCVFGDMIPLSSLNITNGELMIIGHLDAFAPIGILDASQDVVDDSEWTALDYYYSSSDQVDKDYAIVEVNGFRIHHSQVDQVKKIFEEHPDLTSNLNLTSQWLKTVYVDLLLHLIETLSKSPKELTEHNLEKVDNLLSDLTQAGFKVDWLREKLEQKQRASCGTSNVFGRLRGFCRNFFN